MNDKFNEIEFSLFILKYSNISENFVVKFTSLYISKFRVREIDNSQLFKAI